MFYKFVIIHKDRIFPCFQNKVKNLNDIIMIKIIVIRKIIIIQKKMNKKKRFFFLKFFLNLYIRAWLWSIL